MSTEEFIIIVYLIIEEIYPTVVTEPLRKRGFPRFARWNVSDNSKLYRASECTGCHQSA